MRNSIEAISGNSARPASRAAIVVGITLALSGHPLAAQDTDTGYTGFSPARAAVQARYEARLREQVDTASARLMARYLASEPHVAGTRRQRETAFWVDSLMRSWGLKSTVDSYLVYLPMPIKTSLRLLAPDSEEIPLTEPPLAGDKATEHTFPAFNAYSGTGTVQGEVVYVNYGLRGDYAHLDSMGVDLRGKIAVARYGRSFRGIKAREAERHGAVGLVLYSDPADDGYVRGDVYPDGPFRPGTGVQRGSIKNGRGDPSTPEGPSTFDAPRTADSAMPGLPGIPVLPVGYKGAARILSPLRGAPLPNQAWQGGLPFRYHVGPGPVTVKLTVETERGDSAYHTIYNTIATLEGGRFPDERIIVGAHRDAWGPGAVDNVSGTVSVLQTARAFALLARAGMTPARTLVFATWDAEEWGLIGSTEYVEKNEAELQANVIAYINQDSPASGPDFSAAASGSLKEVVREVTTTIPDPTNPGESVYERWVRRSSDIPATEPVSLGDLGGGSDFAGFYNHLGIWSVDFGFGGAGGVYHSAYDTYQFMSLFGDPDFRYHAAASRVTLTLAARLAQAEILPVDNVELAGDLLQIVDRMELSLANRNWDDIRSLRAALGDLRTAAQSFAVERDMVLTADGDYDFTEVNRLVRRVDRTLTRRQGIPGRPWFRNLLFAADRDDGYANVPLPGLSEAIEDNDAERFGEEVHDLEARVRTATAALVRAEQLLARFR